MQHVLETSKRALSAAVAAATIAFSVGAAALVAPATTFAASAGDRIKSSSLSTVYYYGYDGDRYTYPNEKTYKSWHMTSSGGADFSGVQTISDSSLSAISLAGNIVVRPGTYWIKIQSDAKLYAVSTHGKIHWIESEDVARDFRGSDWNSGTTTIDVPDVFFTDYTIGTSLMEATAYDGMTYSMGGTNYIAWDGEMREVTSAGMSANGLKSQFVMDGSSIDDSALSMGADITGKVLAISDDAQTEEGEVVAEGDVVVSESSSMPAGASVPKGANAVEAFRFDVKAGSEDASFDGVTVTLTGAGSTSDLSNVYLYKGETRLTESRSVNSSTRQVTFSSLDEMIDAGDKETYTVRVTVSSSATAANTFGFKIADEADVVVGGDVNGSFPIEGNTFTITGSSVGSVTVTKNGSISDPTLGEQDAEIAQFKIAASGSEGASVESITLKVDNASDHDDYRLWDGSVLVAQGENTDGDMVVFDLTDDAFAIEEGGNNIFTVTADVGGEDSDTIKVYVDNTIDVVAIGTDFGFGLTVDTDDANGYDGSSCTSSSGKCSFSTVQGGDVTIAFNGPAADDIQVDAQDQTLLAFTITADEEVTIKDLDIIVYGDDDDNDPFDGTDDATDTDDDGLIVGSGTNEAGIKDIKIVNADTGAVVMGPLELDGVADSDNDAVQTIDFTEDWTLDAGETMNLEVRADIDNNVESGTEFGAALDVSGLSIEDQNGDDVSSSDIVPGSDITGYAQTARSASLTFALASTPGDVTTVDGTDNVTVVAFAVTAGNASDVNVSDLTLSAYGDDDGSGTSTLGGATNSDINDYVESCSLYEGATRLAGPEAPASNGQTISFDTIDWDLSAGEVTTLSVKCNFANTSTSGSAYFSFDIADVSEDVVAEDEEGNSVTATGDAVNGGTTLASANVVTLADSGTLSIAVGSDTPSADFILAGTTAQTSTFRFTATNEAFNVETLTFSEEQAEDDTGTTNSSAYANNISLVTITYPKADGTTGTKTASMSGNEAKFSGLDMRVNVGAPKDVKVSVTVPGTDRDSGGSATSNEKIRMGLFVDTTGDDNFKASGVGSGETKDDDDQGAIGDDLASTDGIATFVVRETKPTITLSSSSPSGSSVVGRAEVLRFNVAAASNEDVVLETIMFKMNSTDIGGTNWNQCDSDVVDRTTVTTGADFDLYNLTDDGTTTTLDLSSSTDDNDSMTEIAASTDNPWTLFGTDGVACGTTGADVGFVRLDLPTAEVIPAGSTKTFALYFDSTGASASSDDSLRFDLAADPVVSTFIDSGADIADASLTITDTSITLGSANVLLVGDVVCFSGANTVCDAGEEKALVTGAVTTVTPTFARGYLGTNAVLPVTTQNVVRIPGSLLWSDDGSAAVTTSYQEYWGSYLVDNLTVSGGTLVF
jgi:hypothetical protein